MANKEHVTITDPDIHEPKGASTAASGDIYVADGVGSGVWTSQNLLDSYSGWAQYADGQYTTGSPLTVTATTRTKITIDGVEATLESQLPIDGGGQSLWDVATNKITPLNDGDAYDIRFAFKARTLAGTEPFVTLEIDIGGGIGTIVQRTTNLLLGTGVEQAVLLTFPLYTGSTFIANGGEFYVTTSNNTEIYDISVFIVRTHRAR